MPASFYWFWTNLKTTKEVVLDITAQLAPAMKPDQARWLHGEKRIDNSEHDNSEQRLRSAVSRILSVKVICMIPCIEIIPLLYTSVLFFCSARLWMQPRRSADSSVSKLWTPDHILYYKPNTDTIFRYLEDVWKSQFAHSIKIPFVFLVFHNLNVLTCFDRIDYY